MRLVELFELESARKRHNTYLSAMLGVTETQLNFEERSHWENWLVSNGIEAKSPAVEWLHDTVLRSLARIDEIGIRRCTSETELVDFGRRWAAGCGDTKAGCVAVKWGSQKIHGPMGRICAEADHQLGRREDEALIEFHSQRESYEVFSGGYSYGPTLGFFPFYLTSSRKRSWAVLPFGQQRHLAFIGRRAVLNRYFNKTGEAILGQEQLKASNAARVIKPKHFKRAVAGVRAGLKFWYFGVGHAAFQIALDTLDTPAQHHIFREGLRDFGTNSHLLRALTAEAKALDPSSTKRHDEILKAFRGAQLQRLLEFLNDGQNVIVSDLGVVEMQDLIALINTDGKNKDLEWIRFDHGVNVSVGIGFSLCTIPLMMRNPEMLGALLSAISKGLSESSQEHFEEHGILIRKSKSTFSELREINWRQPDEAAIKDATSDELERLINEIKSRFRVLAARSIYRRELENCYKEIKSIGLLKSSITDINAILILGTSSLEAEAKKYNIKFNQKTDFNKHAALMIAAIKHHLRRV